MKKFLVINGCNLNLLGSREVDIYGTETYDMLCRKVKSHGKIINVKVEIFQSNFEGDIICRIQAAKRRNVDAIVINAAAFTHTSIAILDSLKAVNLPTVEVHLTDINSREDFRHFSYISLYAQKVIVGKGIQGYLEAMDYLNKQ